MVRFQSQSHLNHSLWCLDMYIFWLICPVCLLGRHLKRWFWCCKILEAPMLCTSSESWGNGPKKTEFSCHDWAGLLLTGAVTIVDSLTWMTYSICIHDMYRCYLKSENIELLFVYKWFILNNDFFFYFVIWGLIQTWWLLTTAPLSNSHFYTIYTH